MILTPMRRHWMTKPSCSLYPERLYHWVLRIMKAPFPLLWQNRFQRLHKRTFCFLQNSRIEKWENVHFVSFICSEKLRPIIVRTSSSLVGLVFLLVERTMDQIKELQCGGITKKKKIFITLSNHANIIQRFKKTCH